VLEEDDRMEEEEGGKGYVMKVEMEMKNNN
jgi:hypothetical protein